MAIYNLNFYGKKNKKKTNLQLALDHPTVDGEVVKHWNEKLQASVPMSKEKHQQNQVKNAHKLVGHVQELEEAKQTVTLGNSH